MFAHQCFGYGPQATEALRFAQMWPFAPGSVILVGELPDESIALHVALVIARDDEHVSKGLSGTSTDDLRALFDLQTPALVPMRATVAPPLRGQALYRLMRPEVVEVALEAGAEMMIGLNVAQSHVGADVASLGATTYSVVAHDCPIEGRTSVHVTPRSLFPAVRERALARREEAGLVRFAWAQPLPMLLKQWEAEGQQSWALMPMHPPTF
jgi:hypothetical protein